MWNLMTLDGCFEGPTPWSIDWHNEVWGEELEQFSLEQSRSVGILVFGRVTYQGMAAYWSTAKGATAEGATADFMNSVPKVVASRTLVSAEWNNTRLVRGDIVAEVTALKAQPGKDLYIFGSADLCATLSRQGLIDEYRIGLAPMVLGQGRPLFKENPDALRLTLVETRPLRSGCVILRYRRRT